MEKRVDASLLISFYGAMLTERQRELLGMYYEDDLSLSEIAQIAGVTRQAAHDAIRRGEAQLILLEEKLGLRARWTRMVAGLMAARDALTAGDGDMALETIGALLREEEEQDGV